MSSLSWNYSSLAAHYDNRADYDKNVISAAVARMGLAAGTTVADIGAGTGKLSRPLLEAGLTVLAVEPNDEMRAFGVRNTEGATITWSVGQGEATGLPDHRVDAVWFGSSFNVVDQAKTLAECRRILTPGGWFACLWNHRSLEDPLQAAIEQTIKRYVPDYNYGSRREDPTPVLAASGLFGPIEALSGAFSASMTRDAVLDAWRSHGTLARQAGDAFQQVIAAIDALLPTTPTLDVPYSTRLWLARLAPEQK